MKNPTQLYIDLLKRCVGNFLYDDDLDLLHGRVRVDPESGECEVLPGQPVPAPQREKYLGSIWPSRAHTMIGMPRLDNLHETIERVLADRVPGDLIETGVWRGGATIFMRGVLAAHGVVDRVVWVADSFAGLPPGDPSRYPRESKVPFDRFQELVVPLTEVRDNFARYQLLDEQVRFLPGWFRDTLSTAPIERLAILRLDGDLYESTMDALVHLYPKLSPGGYCIIDDFDVVMSANAAVEDFRREQGISQPLVRIQGGGAYWRR
jgi:O-methyltransferase